MEDKKIDLNNSLFKNNLVTYLGNKRKLIGFIDEVVSVVIQKDLKEVEEPRFLDMFSGTGVVSRYAKLKGFQTFANDLETYARVLSYPYIELNTSDFNDIFYKVVQKYSLKSSNKDYYQAVIDYLNSLTKIKNNDNLYFSIHYAPKDTNNSNFENERLFYTQENAYHIDCILEELNSGLFCEKSKNIILASLLCEMSVHINTSGVMKGFHNGFGGPNGDAKLRIMSPIKLEKLPKLNGKIGKVYSKLAENLFEEENLDVMDVVYLDPPYNCHQYSANYHLLTTAVQYDFYNPGPVEKGSRAGIRKDHNRSVFCAKRQAKESFEKLLKTLKAKWVLVSYNNEGIISQKDMKNMLSKVSNGNVFCLEKDYAKFRGSRNNKDNHKVKEHLFVANLSESENFVGVKESLNENSIINSLFVSK